MLKPRPERSLSSHGAHLRSHLIQHLEHFRHRLAFANALPQLTALGLAVGIAASLIITLFRLLVFGPLALYLPEHSENFEGLSNFWRFAVPFFGAVTIGLSLQLIKRSDLSGSVGHVLDRLHNYQGVLPLKNFLVQFFAGAASLVTGQSVGREGPAVHLGAGAASLLGQWLKLPNNSLRTLVGCGVAAAIAASFNTPMAGVIFAMEVVLMEYTITGFVPVILASVSGSVISQLVFPESSAFAVTPIEMNSLLELPFMVFGGLVIAVFSATFIRAQLVCFRFHHLPIWLRLALAGLVTGTVGVFVPQVLGMGYDSLSAAMLGQISFSLLMVIVVSKLFVTGFSMGMGMPGGIIGPTLVIGGCVGGIIGYAGNALFPEQASNPGFYVILGMAAMMGSVLNAPLAALIAVLELTYNPNIIFPSMLMIVVACFVTQQVFHCQGIFVEQLKLLGSPIRSEPAQQILSRIGVVSVMNTAFVQSPQLHQLKNVYQLLHNKPTWIVVDVGPEEDKVALRAVDLANYLEGLKLNEELPEKHEKQEQQEETEIDLLNFPAQRFKLLPIHQRASLYEANDLLKRASREVLFVEKVHGVFTPKVIGIISRTTINNYYST